MNRIILIIMLCISSIYAEEIEQFPFIGVTVSTHTIDIQNVKSYSNDETIAGIRYGQQTLKWRTMFTYEFEQNGYKSFTVEIDKILRDEIYGITKIRPYLGVSLGMIDYVNDNLYYEDNATKNTNNDVENPDHKDDGGDVDTSGYFYGLNLGLIIYVTDSIDMDIGYHYYDVQDFEGLNKIQGLTFSLHYFY